jgi:hypothetical protein
MKEKKNMQIVFAALVTSVLKDWRLQYEVKNQF